VPLLKTLTSLLVYPPFIALKLVLILVGIPTVGIGLLFGWRIPKLYLADWGRPFTFWEMVVRNPISGLKHYLQDPGSYTQTGHDIPHDEIWKQPFYFRFRRHGWFLSSIRMVWTYGDDHYGELYFGFKLGSVAGELDFGLSIRPYNDNGT